MQESMTLHIKNIVKPGHERWSSDEVSELLAANSVAIVVLLQCEVLAPATSITGAIISLAGVFDQVIGHTNQKPSSTLAD